MNTPTKILVTGARGFLGSTLILDFKTAGLTPIAFEGDITDPADVESAFSADVEAVIHTAGRIEVPWCEANPEEARRINVGGTQKLLEAAQKKQIPFVCISTASVFSGEKGNYTEKDTRNPVNVYSKTKAEAEDVSLTYEHGYVVRLNLLGVRPDGAPGKNFLEWVLTSAKKGESVTLFTDQRTNPISNWTAARAIRALLMSASTERIIHLGTNTPLSKYESGLAILEQFGVSTKRLVPTHSDDLNDGIARPKEMWLNTDLANRLLFPMPRFEEELETIQASLSF